MPARTSIWILVSFCFLSLSTVTSQPSRSLVSRLIKTQPTSAEQEFANDIKKLCTFKSGKRYLHWPMARGASKRNEELLSFSREIHKQMDKSGRNMKVKEAILETVTIQFQAQDLKPMTADIIKYKVEKHGGSGVGYIWYFVTRGPRDDCVYGLWLVSEAEKVYQVGNNSVPICGIRWNLIWRY